MTTVKKPSAGSLRVQAAVDREKSNRRIWLAILLLVVVALAIVGGIYLQDEAEIERARVELIDDVDSALADDATEVEQFRRLEKQIENWESQHGAVDATIVARARIAFRTGASKKAWETIRGVAERPGVAGDTALLSARIAALRAATGDDETLLRRGLSLAYSAEAEKGAVAVGWTLVLAHRLGDTGEFVGAADRLRSRHPDSETAAELVPTLPILASLLAQREGLVIDGESPSDDPDAQRLRRLRDETRDSVLRDSVEDPRFPETLIASAWARLLQANDEAGPGEVTLRAGLQDARKVLETLPSSIEARELCARCLYALSQLEPLTDSDLGRLRGHLAWLLTHAPESHVSRGLWAQMQSSI